MKWRSVNACRRELHPKRSCAGVGVFRFPATLCHPISKIPRPFESRNRRIRRSREAQILSLLRCCRNRHRHCRSPRRDRLVNDLQQPNRMPMLILNAQFALVEGPRLRERTRR